jgi:hypothetical protein
VRRKHKSRNFISQHEFYDSHLLTSIARLVFQLTGLRSIPIHRGQKTVQNSCNYNQILDLRTTIWNELWGPQILEWCVNFEAFYLTHSAHYARTDTFLCGMKNLERCCKQLALWYKIETKICKPLPMSYTSFIQCQRLNWTHVLYFINTLTVSSFNARKRPFVSSFRICIQNFRRHLVKKVLQMWLPEHCVVGSSTTTQRTYVSWGGGDWQEPIL